jgi:hypothetical protein
MQEAERQRAEAEAAAAAVEAVQQAQEAERQRAQQLAREGSWWVANPVPRGPPTGPHTPTEINQHIAQGVIDHVRLLVDHEDGVIGPTTVCWLTNREIPGRPQRRAWKPAHQWPLFKDNPTIVAQVAAAREREQQAQAQAQAARAQAQAEQQARGYCKFCRTGMPASGQRECQRIRPNYSCYGSQKSTITGYTGVCKGPGFQIVDSPFCRC